MFDTDRQTDQTETGRKPRGDITTCATFDTQRYILRRKRALSQLVALLQLLDEGPQPVVGRELLVRGRVRVSARARGRFGGRDRVRRG